VDIDGNQFIDCHMAYSSAILGHNPPAVAQAVSDAMCRGLGVGFAFEEQAELAELVQSMVPGTQAVAFFHTGGEAIQAAVRMARCATGKTRIAKFEGCYHGSNEVGLYNPWMSLTGVIPEDPLDNIAPKIATGGLGATPDSQYLILPYNSQIALKLIEQQASALAAIVVEPLPAFMSPYADQAKQFMTQLHAVASANKVPLIFDEIVGGFRLAQGGAREWLGLTPQISCFGKITSGLGLPLSMVAGESNFLETGRTSGFGRDSANSKVWVSSTVQAGFLPVIAALAQLRFVKNHFSEIATKLDNNFRNLSEQLSDISNNLGVELRLSGNPRTQVHLAIAEGVPENADYRSIMRSSSHASFLSLMAMTLYLRLQGVYTKIVPSMNLSFAHQDDDIDRLAIAIRNAVEQMCLDGVLTSGAKV
jgi:glutamate-1-semialdehyde aminotransferase